MSITKLLCSDGYIPVNKHLIKELGLEAAIIIGELSREYEYHLKRNNLTNDGYFFSTIENIQEKTSIKEKRQRIVINELKSKGILDTCKRGLPSKRYIKINELELFKIFQTDSYSSACQTELETSPEATNNNIYNNNINNKKQSVVKTTDRVKKKYDIESDEYKLVDLFVKLMEKQSELFKAPKDYSIWCDSMRKILDIDLKEKYEDRNDRCKVVQQAIVHSCSKHFFYKNIRSIDSLRRRLGEVFDDSKASNYKKPNNNYQQQPTTPTYQVSAFEGLTLD